MLLSVIAAGLAVLFLSSKTIGQDSLPNLLAASAAPGAAGSVVLRYKFHVGDVLAYQVSMDSAGKSTFAGTTAPMSSDLAGTLTMTVVSVDSLGNATLDERFSALSLRASANGQPIAVPDLSLAALKSGFTVVFTPVGEITSFKENALGKGGPPNMDADQLMGSQEVTGFAGFPTEAVAIGSSWRNSPGDSASAAAPGAIRLDANGRSAV